jgi:pyruvate formate-lyase activating enzyme-like uncharacterized protein
LIGIIEPQVPGRITGLVDAKKILIKQFKVPNNLLLLDRSRHRLEVAPWVLEELKDIMDGDLTSRCFIVEEYPTADRLEVERIPLNEFN